MINIWPAKRIEDISEKVGMGPFGSSIKVETFVSEGVPIISGQHLHGFKLDDSVGYNYITAQHAEKLKGAIVHRGDIVFTHAGNIGQVAVITKDSQHENYVLSQRQFFLRCDPEKSDPEYIVAYFKSPEGRHKLLANTSQVGVPSISKPVTYLRSIEIPLPPLSEQRAIAHILGTLDDKIENNRKTAKTLEAMAQAIFQSWFVDFDPVRAKRMAGESKESTCKRLKLTPEILDLFPDRLVDSELGEIPEGWEVGTLDKFADLVTESISPAKSPRTFFEHYSIPAFDAGRMPATELGESIKSNKYMVKHNAVLVSKLNPHTSRIWLPAIGNSPAVCSTEFMQFVPHALEDRPYLYCLMTSQSMQEEVLKHVTGSTGSRQRAQPSQIAKVKIFFPQSYIHQAFTDQAAPLLHAIALSLTASRTLAVLRDTLLPKLISGEIRVPGAERLLEESRR